MISLSLPFSSISQSARLFSSNETRPRPIFIFSSLKTWSWRPSGGGCRRRPRTLGLVFQKQRPCVGDSDKQRAVGLFGLAQLGPWVEIVRFTLLSSFMLTLSVSVCLVLTCLSLRSFCNTDPQTDSSAWPSSSMY